ncbi:peptidoglycan DD-metalloendopeptidase family protein [candidate division GN15 bacterium]|nr:peptidoglycan DD-metalloendopeptidase family protein [candidate division GN15 bacterium]
MACAARLRQQATQYNEKRRIGNNPVLQIIHRHRYLGTFLQPERTRIDPYQLPMKKISTTTRACLALLALAAVTGWAATLDWPLKTRIDVSSGFGDYRARRFHAGIDLRTGGAVGKDLYAPVAGSVWRLRTSYEGYGKVLYLKGDDGYIYVFAHLNGFAPKIDATVKQAQVAAQRYYVDLTLPPDSLRIEKGEQIGATGKTGAGAPHLHFEKRTANNVPVNPLLNGFTLNDKTRPTFERLGLVMADRRSVFADGTRKLFLPVTKGAGPGKYRIDEKLYFDSPFGVMVDSYDQMRPGGMRQSIYSLRLYIDDRPYYEISLDSLYFRHGPMSDLEFDNVEAANDSRRVRRLYEEVGNEFLGSRPIVGTRGLVGDSDNLSPGLHRARIVGEDCFGNRSELNFDFVWGPPENVCRVDSVAATDRNTIEARLSATPAIRELAVKEVRIEMFDRSEWIAVDTLDADRLLTGGVPFSFTSPKRLAQTILRCVAVTAEGVAIPDEPFHGLAAFDYNKLGIEPVVVEDGLLVYVHSRTQRAGDARLELYHQDSLLGVESPARFLSPFKYVFFIPPDPRYARVDELRAALSTNPNTNAGVFADVMIRLVGDEPAEMITVDTLMQVHFEADDFYEPRYVALRKVDTTRMGDLNSDLYEIYPEAFLTRRDFEASIGIRAINQVNHKSGLCWWDQEENEWVWLTDSEWDDERRLVSASSRGGGRFAAVYDLTPPAISHINIRAGMTYYNPRPLIKFSLADNLSGIEDDRAIDIRLNGEWLIPEYDPESEECKTRPLERLEDGNHHLAIKVTDRAGNTAEQYLQFYVRDKSRN